MIEGQDIDQRADPDAFGALGGGRKENRGGSRIAQRRAVMLGDVIAVDPAPVVGLDDFQPILEVFP